jgi:hypothetical protein
LAEKNKIYAWDDGPGCSMQHRQQLFVGVAFVVTTIFLGVSYAGESADYIPACPTKFIKAWNAWIQQTRRHQKNRVC